jgi:signal transduction histidine kinase
MLKQILDHHSGRGIAVSRLALAVLFLLVLYGDPYQPVRDEWKGYLIAFSYVALSLALLVVTWNNWWLDYKLRLPALLGDGAMYITAVYFTQSGSTDFTSPYLSFFIFISLSATLRWGLRGMAVVALALSLSYVGAGVWLELAGYDIELYRFGRRGVYMILLSLILVWFGLQRRRPTVGRLDLAASESGDMPLARIAEYAMRETASPAAAVAWWSDEDPYALAFHSAGSAAVEHLPAEALPRPDQAQLALFDRGRRRMLIVPAKGRFAAINQRFAASLTDHFGIDEGLAIPIASTSGRGLIVITGNRGFGIDHLGLAEGLAQEIEAALDRQLIGQISSEAMVSRLRTTLARDLHDSVAQTLAGVGFRLEAIRAQVRAGHDPEEDFAELRASLSSEHKHLRLMIERLRDTDLEPRRVDLAAQLKGVASELERTWHTKLSLTADPQDIAVPVELAFEIMQITREAVANGVRHGSARRFDIAIARSGAGLSLDIRDDGTGFAEDPAPLPRSLAERARANGGQLTICNVEAGARLLIELPNRT